VGGIKTLGIDVRVIAATHRDLESMVREGTFREYLYYRINVIPLRLKPLRERREDISLYLHHFLYRYGTLLQKGRLELDSRLTQRLAAYEWPGNIRQLENVVEYMVNMAEEAIVTCGDLPEYLHLDSDCYSVSAGSTEGNQGLEQRMCMYEKAVLEQFFDDPNYGQDKAVIAEQLQISLSTLYRKMEKYGLI